MYTKQVPLYLIILLFILPGLLLLLEANSIDDVGIKNIGIAFSTVNIALNVLSSFVVTGLLKKSVLN